MLLQAGIIILHDNLWLHDKDCFICIWWIWLRKIAHPPYSLNMSLLDYNLFYKLKESLGEVSFRDLIKLNNTLSQWIHELNSGKAVKQYTVASQTLAPCYWKLRWKSGRLYRQGCAKGANRFFLPLSKLVILLNAELNFILGLSWFYQVSMV